MTTLEDSFDQYLKMVDGSRRANTYKTYRQAITRFKETLVKREISLDEVSPNDANPLWIDWYIKDLTERAATTEGLFLTAIAGWYEFIAADYDSPVNLNKVRTLIKRRSRKPAPQLPQFDRDEIEKVISYTESLPAQPANDHNERLRRLRDRAFILTLADTGLRISEACNLNRGQIDWKEGRAIIPIKGGRDDVVRFSKRSLAAIKAYLSARATLDGKMGRTLASLPVFARHDRAAGKKVMRLNHMGARDAVMAVVNQAGAITAITPHSFRHYFVTVVMRASGGNLKVAQRLARHRSIAVTQRYAHIDDNELDSSYHDIFNKK